MLIRMKESDENIVRDGVIYFDSSNMGVNYEWALNQLCQMLVNVTKEKRFGLIDINVQRDSLLIREKISLYQKEKSLAVLYPEVAKEWHPTRNGSLTPEMFSAGANTKVWWQCSKGHEWEAIVNNRSKGAGCPICANARLLQGYNDLATVYPQILKEWHPTKNGNLTPKDVLSGTNKKVWWICPKGHEWKASINARASRNDGCPICSNKKVLKGYNDLETISPELAKEWNPTNNGLMKPSDVTSGSGKKIWWQCSKGHEWQAKVSDRFIKKSGCPICTNYTVLEGHNDLQTVYPEIAKEWHPTKNGALHPTDVICGSDKKVWWQCAKGHEWKTHIKSRTGRNCKCPICSNKQVLHGYNDLATIYPEIAKEWHPIKNGELQPTDITCGSGRKVWWKCSECNNEWKTTVTSRTARGEGCPLCSRKRGGVLRTQTIIYKKGALEENYPKLAQEWNSNKNGDLTPAAVNCGSEKKVWWQCSKGHEWEAAITNRVGQNQGCPICSNKKLLTGFNDLQTVRPEIAEEWHPTKNGGLMATDVVCGSHKKVWWKCAVCGNEWQAVVNSRTSNGAGCSICSKKRAVNKKVKNIILKEGSLEDNYPEITKQWNSLKNGDLKPSDVSGGSNKKVWWKCSKNHEWQSCICDRTGQNQGCPVCSGKIVLAGYNDLGTINPQVAKEWHPNKNHDLKPSDVTCGSNKKVWWKCSKCGWEWEAIINNRARKGTACPQCMKKGKKL